MPKMFRRSFAALLLIVLLTACGGLPAVTVSPTSAAPVPAPTIAAYPGVDMPSVASDALPAYPNPPAGFVATDAYPGPAAVGVPILPVAGGFDPTVQGQMSAPILVPTVIASYPHDPLAYTQGLVYLGADRFYEGTGLYGQSSLREVSLNGEQLRPIVRLPDQYFGEGVAVVGETIFQLTWQECVGLLYDRELRQIGQFVYQNPLPQLGQPCSTQGWGLTHDGTRLIMSNGSSTLFFVDPAATIASGVLAVTGQLQVRDALGPISQLNELEYINGLIYANIYQTDLIARIDPTTGLVQDYLDLSGLRPLLQTDPQRPPPEVLNGIAYDPDTKRIFVTGKFWPNLFEIALPTTSWRLSLPMIQS